MIIDKYELSPLTQAVCAAFEKYHAGHVLQSIMENRDVLASEYTDTIQSHFACVAAGEFDLDLANPKCSQFLTKQSRVEFLVWLMMTVKDPSISAKTASKFYVDFKTEIDQFLVSELKKKLPEVKEGS
jgi:hypothetical protein